MPNVPGAMFIPGATSIPESAVSLKRWINKVTISMFRDAEKLPTLASTYAIAVEVTKSTLNMVKFAGGSVYTKK